ncbi:CoA transferase [Rhodopseudomonas boonkerdii]|uniref:CaiB/BaiF CoA transferase family protein n=1 Tax=Rhodopseudomonas boonkerdii TaxID=475937 RepID=UPI001E57E4AD|nr:CaiB/BaiF CoA-transferase family protein [Rhodopseudomonas boonkerdii]UGV28630.1 CoA transferase [Rhodopseudomonas boonkerdii]
MTPGVSNAPLDDIRVLDFSTLLPGPFASLMLAEAGAHVVKIERPGRGDEMRSYEPKFGDDSVNFALLNAGKKSIAIDLKAKDSIARLRPLIAEADVVIEQFRPGVMDRLGLGYEAMKAINPKIIYCAVTGWGQTGPKAMIAAHDLNYLAESGILGLSADRTGAPIIPPVLIADLAAGAYPAMTNILLALRKRDRTGEGSYIDISMGDNLLGLAYWGLGNGFAANDWPGGSDALVTGGSPRYQIYRTKDDRYLAAAPIEEKFWDNFCTAIELPAAMRAPDADWKTAIDAVGKIIAGKTSIEWMAIFEGKDVCCSIVASLKDAVADPHVKARGLLDRKIAVNGRTIPAIPVPISTTFRSAERSSPPALGADTDAILSK